MTIENDLILSGAAFTMRRAIISGERGIGHCVLLGMLESDV